MLFTVVLLKHPSNDWEWCTECFETFWSIVVKTFLRFLISLIKKCVLRFLFLNVYVFSSWSTFLILLSLTVTGSNWIRIIGLTPTKSHNISHDNNYSQTMSWTLHTKTVILLQRFFIWFEQFCVFIYNVFIKLFHVFFYFIEQKRAFYISILEVNVFYIYVLKALSINVPLHRVPTNFMEWNSRTFSTRIFGCRCLQHANVTLARSLLLKLTISILTQYSVVRVRGQLIDITNQLNNQTTEFT